MPKLQCSEGTLEGMVLTNMVLTNLCLCPDGATNVVFLPPGNTLAQLLPPPPASPTGKQSLLRCCRLFSQQPNERLLCST